MDTSLPRAGDGRAVGGGIRRTIPARRATVPERVRRAVPRARRGDPQAVPCARGHGADRAGERGRGAVLGRRLAARAMPRAPRAAGRLPRPAGDRPRRHGGRLRGRAGLAGPARGAEGPAPTDAPRPEAAAAVRAGGALGGAAAPHQHRAGLRGRRGRRAALLRDAVHPGAGSRHDSGRAAAAAGAGGAARPDEAGRPRPEHAPGGVGRGGGAVASDAVRPGGGWRAADAGAGRRSRAGPRRHEPPRRGRLGGPRRGVGDLDRGVGSRAAIRGNQGFRPTGGVSRASRCRWPRRWPMPTRRACCIETSSRRTCSWIPAATSGSPISGSRSRRTSRI